MEGSCHHELDHQSVHWDDEDESECVGFSCCGCTLSSQLPSAPINCSRSCNSFVTELFSGCYLTDWASSGAYLIYNFPTDCKKYPFRDDSFPNPRIGSSMSFLGHVSLLCIIVPTICAALVKHFCFCNSWFDDSFLNTSFFFDRSSQSTALVMKGEPYRLPFRFYSTIRSWMRASMTWESRSITNLTLFSSKSGSPSSLCHSWRRLFHLCSYWQTNCTLRRLRCLCSPEEFVKMSLMSLRVLRRVRLRQITPDCPKLIRMTLTFFSLGMMSFVFVLWRIILIHHGDLRFLPLFEGNQVISLPTPDDSQIANHDETFRWMWRLSFGSWFWSSDETSEKNTTLLSLLCPKTSGTRPPRIIESSILETPRWYKYCAYCSSIFAWKILNCPDYCQSDRDELGWMQTLLNNTSNECQRTTVDLSFPILHPSKLWYLSCKDCCVSLSKMWYGVNPRTWCWTRSLCSLHDSESFFSRS